jgi:uncharacterized protein YbjT (DUF2867 family)
MKIVVIGGTGLIGSKLVSRLRDQRHEAAAASPGTGVDTVTGQGLAEALAGARVVVDVSNAPDWDDAALSVVGTDRLQGSGYFRAKLAQEEAIKAAAIPSTILRATQFFEFTGRIADSSTHDGTVSLPPILFQPEAADDVAAALADIAEGAPVNGTVELAGPERFRLDELVRRYLRASKDPRHVVTDARAPYYGLHVTDERALIPGDKPRIGATRFADWLARSARPTTPQPHLPEGISA